MQASKLSLIRLAGLLVTNSGDADAARIAAVGAAAIDAGLSESREGGKTRWWRSGMAAWSNLVLENWLSVVVLY